MRGDYGDSSKPTGSGRVYSVENGTIHHNIGPQPELVVNAPTEGEVEKIAKEFGLPL